MQWIDQTPLGSEILITQLETKNRYFCRMSEAREAARQARQDHERLVRQQEIRLKGKEDELTRRRQVLGAREAALKRQEEEFEAREAQLRQQRDAKKNKQYHDEGTSSSKTNFPKFIRFTQ